MTFKKDSFCLDVHDCGDYCDIQFYMAYPFRHTLQDLRRWFEEITDWLTEQGIQFKVSKSFVCGIQCSHRVAMQVKLRFG